MKQMICYLLFYVLILFLKNIYDLEHSRKMLNERDIRFELSSSNNNNILNASDPFELYLGYITTGRLKLTGQSLETLADLLAITHYFKNIDLAKKIEAYLKSRFTTENIFQLIPFAFSNALRNSSFLQDCAQFIDKNLEKMIEANAFSHISLEVLAEFIDRKIVSEETNCILDDVLNLKRQDSTTTTPVTSTTRATITSIDNDDELIVASGSNDQNIHLWSLTTASILRTLVGNDSTVVSIARLPTGQLVSASSNGRIRVWNTLSGACEYTWFNQDRNVNVMRVLSNNRVAIGSWFAAVKIYDVTSGQLLTTLQTDGYYPTKVILVLYEEKLLSASYNQIHVWNSTSTNGNY